MNLKIIYNQKYQHPEEIIPGNAGNMLHFRG